MTSQTDDEWTLCSLTPSQLTDMDSITHDLPDTHAPPICEHTVNTRSALDDDKSTVDCTWEDPGPRPARQDSFESIDDGYGGPRRAGRRPISPPYRRYASPPRRRHAPVPQDETHKLLSSSMQLLAKVGKDDGMMDLPSPSHTTIYLATYPFSDKDVKKWSWLFAANIEDEFLADSSRGFDSNGNSVRSVERVGQRRDDYYPYDPDHVHFPSVYLSRALDVEIISEDSKHKVWYLIVTQSRQWPAGSKLLIAESRKAAGIIMYYEVLRGDSIVFVGATLHQCKKTREPKKYRKVAGLEEAVSIQSEGYVGIIC